MTSINPDNQTITQYALQVGGANNNLASISAVATGSLLASGGTSANPAWSAYPQISGLGIGASPGSTAGITFDASNFMNVYISGTWTPTLIGATTAGTTTYSNQYGYYTKIGNIVFCYFYISITAATGTGGAEFSLPTKLISQTNGFIAGNCIVNSTGWTFAGGKTTCNASGTANNQYVSFVTEGTSTGAGTLQMANAAGTFQGSVIYQSQ